ncbi:MAG TPA: hypothetical protein VF062_03940 [Candidatus Limnocylindrales bacterium]
MTLRRLTAVLLAFGLITTFPAGVAGAEDKPIYENDDPKAGSNAAAELMAAQAPLVEAAEAISRLDKEGTGLGGIRLRVLERGMDIHWKGEAPAELYEVVDKLAGAGYRAEVAEARYSGAELAAVQEEIVRGAQEYHHGIATVGPLADGSGLRVGLRKEGARPKEWPVEVVETVDEDEMVFIDRFNDTPPFWGGGVARLGFQTCSTGFAVFRRNWFTVTTGILTAHHCGRGGGITVTNGTGTRTIGVAEVPSAATASHNSDSLFVPASSHPRMFDGPPVGAFTKPVVGWGHNFVGQFVCTSGASTGVHCDIITEMISTTALVRTGFSTFERVDRMVMGSAIGFNAVAAGSGDSGGPVFTLTNNFADVRAAGLMSIAQFPVPCNVTGPTFCGNRVGFVDIGWVLHAQQADILR